MAMCEQCGYHGCLHDQADEYVDPCANCGPSCDAWGGDGLCQYQIDAMAHADWMITESVAQSMARAIRIAVVQQQYDAGRLSEAQAREILSGSLTPGGDNVFDDSGELRVKV
jgi:hypothetical protein